MTVAPRFYIFVLSLQAVLICTFYESFCKLGILKVLSGFVPDFPKSRTF
jgi:hypothetical protein